MYFKKILPLQLNLQFFAADTGGDGGGDAGSQGSGTDGSDDQTGDDKGDQGAVFTPEQQAQIDALIKAGQDQVRNDLGKKNKSLQATINQLSKQGKSAEEIAADAQRELDEGKQALVAEKNRFHAVRQLSKAGLDDSLLDFVVTADGEDETVRNQTTDNRIKTLQGLIDKQVKAQVDAKFKENGYNPGKGADKGAGSFEDFTAIIAKNQIKKPQ
ncbi:capsid assembly scaffolding protein Gp46 family protein [Exiguobacterium antarcticum]|uniref:capsid assembly scaffolding protein Gp46 family protein n=1 Tax=Exiguobacterium antarcticum TaxID=132920 RepID=UPI000478F531|nr:DUF4355 domain-containing protein [Exiguobacterium antarcticum]